MRLFNVKMAEQVGHISVIGDGACGHFCLPIAAHVVADHAVMLGKNAELLIPHPAISDPGVDQEQWMALTSNFVVQTRSLAAQEASHMMGVLSQESTCLSFARERR